MTNIFLPIHTVHGVLAARILEWFSLEDHILSELSTMTCPSWVALYGMVHSFTELDKAVVHVIRLVSFLWLWFQSVCPLMEKDKRLMEASDGRDWLRGKLGLVLMGRAMLSKSLIWFSVDRMWSTGEGTGKPLQYSCLENPMNSMKRQKNRTLKHELPRSVGA